MFGRIAWRGTVPLTLLAAFALLIPAGCEQKRAVAPAKPGAQVEQAHHHSHGEKGPHGGALVALGGHVAHLEVLLDEDTGKVTAYVLDGEAKNPVPIQVDEFVMTFTEEHDHDDADDKDKKDADELPEDFKTLTLKAVSPAQDGTTSQFAGVAEELKEAHEFHALILTITINGKPYEKVEFDYPQGNEHLDH